MIAGHTPQFDDRLMQAMTAENPTEELGTLRRLPADPALSEQVRRVLGLIDDLSALGAAIDRVPTPRLQLPDLTPRRRLRWAWAASAAAVAATIVIAISLLLVDPPPGVHPEPEVGLPSLALDWNLPAIEPVSLADQSFSLPALTMPSLSFTWSIPSLEIPSAPAGDDADAPDGTTRPAASARPADRLDQPVSA